MRRPYAAGAAILLTLLLSTAIGTQVDWVYLGDVQEAAPPASEAPVGAALVAPGAVKPAEPERGSADGMPLDYIYLFDTGTGGNYIPWWGNSYTSYKAQYLYLASEINKTGTIAQAGLFKNYYAAYYNTFNNTSVKLCHTTVTTLTTNYSSNYGGNTPIWVYHGDLPRGMPQRGTYDTLDFTTYFNYNGTDNLIVEVLWSGRTAAVGIPSYTSNGSGYRRCYGIDTAAANASGRSSTINSCRLGFLGLPNDVGVTQILSPADPFYAFNDTFFMKAQVKNFGLNVQPTVPVHCIIRDSATNTIVYDETVTISLAFMQTDTVDFPGFYAPPMSEKVYIDTMRTELAGDQVPSNDMKVLHTPVTEWGSQCVSYCDGVWENGTRYITSPYTGEYLTQFTMVGNTLPKANIWLSDIPASTVNKRIRVYAMDGTGGEPGTVLYDQVQPMTAAYWPAVTKNEITFGPPIAIPPTVTVIGVSYGWNGTVSQFVCTDQTPPIEVGNDWGRELSTSPWGHTMSPPWGDATNDYGIEACFRAKLLDGSCIDVTIPAATVDSNTTFTPQILIKNAGLKARTNIPVAINIIPDDPLDPSYTATANSGPIAVGETKLVDFATPFAPLPGTYTAYGITLMPLDTQYDNDTATVSKFVRYYDVKTEIVSPRPQEVPGLVPVMVKLTNMGNVPAMVPRVDITIMPSLYADYREAIPAIAPGANMIITLAPWVCPAGGNETATAWITDPADMNHSDAISADTAVRPVRTGIPGWVELTPMPAPPSGKYVKDGGCMAYDAGSDLIYASKGYKTGDVYAYDVDAGTWTPQMIIPLGAEGKQAYKGSVICSDGNGKLYLTKGNNTVGFWELGGPADAKVWTQKTNVPTGASGKKVKQGAGIAWASSERVGHPCAYLLKGYRNEFYRYDPVANGGNGEWRTLLDAPIGSANHVKWNDGSWLVADADAGNLLYAFKSKYHEFYTYDTDADTWSRAKNAMPIPGSAGNKKAKTGSCAAWYSGKLYAFKGGNTNEFWRYFPLGDSWQKQPDVPLYGYSGSRKKVKAGAALVGHPGTGIYAFKGNKSLEFWRYTPYDVVAGGQPNRDGVTAGTTEIGAPSFAIAPNPLAGGFATVRYSLPRAGLATLNVFDVTGRTVLTQTLAAGRTGTASLDLRKLEAGVYLVKVTTEGFSTTQKLVVEH